MKIFSCLQNENVFSQDGDKTEQDDGEDAPPDQDTSAGGEND